MIKKISRILIVLVVSIFLLGILADTSIGKPQASPAYFDSNSKTITPNPTPTPEAPSSILIPSKKKKGGGGCVTLFNEDTGTPYDIYFPLSGRVVSGWSCTVLKEYVDEDGKYRRAKVYILIPHSPQEPGMLLSVYWSNVKRPDIQRFWDRRVLN